MDFFREIRERIRKLEEREEGNVWQTLAYVGSVGAVFLLPVILGAYIGWWLDGKYKGGSISWTITFILLGVMIGAYNVYRLFYRKEVSR